MKRVLTAIVLIPLVLLAVLRAPASLFAFLVAVVTLVTVSEFLQLTTHYQLQPFPRVTYVLVILLFGGIAIQSGQTPLVSTAGMMYGVGFAGVIGAFILLVAGMRNTDLRTAFPGAAASAFSITYIALPFALLAQLRQQWAGAILILYLLIVVWVGDTAAYYAGRLFGRHKLAPRISPGKTWEGTVASFVVSVFVGSWFFTNAKAVSTALLKAHLISQSQGFFAPQPPDLSTLFILSALINIAAQLGDLVESLIKRGAGVKDSGALLPGHGGMLDRVDALLFAAPVLWYYSALRVLSS
ncbi:MAG TPA: phosphatidate cytidylyltransferase [Terriglobales bacterium]|nr:phosphatidate cytidylyltransferase [Terriglobales bacterium]